MASFQIIGGQSRSAGPRLGRLALRDGKTLETPHYIGVTSRGVIPHLTPDMIFKNTAVQGVYVSLEDFIEKAPRKTPPLVAEGRPTEESSLKNFIALPHNQILILGARRTSPIPCPNANTQSAISILTSVGFSQIENERYLEMTEILAPDIFIGLADLTYGAKSGLKRIEKMTSRTEKWTSEAIEALDSYRGNGAKSSQPLLFAPVLPIDHELQSLYLGLLNDEWLDRINGLAFYSTNTMVGLPQPLVSLPRIHLGGPSSPLELLNAISHGADIFTIPFINAATDAGIALNFQFPPPSDVNEKQSSLGIDMWLIMHASDLNPLSRDCQCYACKKHHRAYVQHLLSAKEMLAWVLIQVHNLHILDEFFAGVRNSINDGRYDTDCAAFARYYDSALPDKTGQGPRVRGYQFKSEGPNEPKRNPVAYHSLGNAIAGDAETALPSPSVDAADLEHKGFAEVVD